MLYVVLGALWFASLIVSSLFGFYLRTLSDRTKKLFQAIEVLAEQVKKKKEPQQTESPSSFIDMEDPAEVLRWEHEQALKQLNPEQYDE